MEEPEVTVLDVESSYLSESMQQKLNKLWGQPNETENFTIFRAPCNIRKTKKNLFEPFVVSIGPFHRGHTSLHSMEEKKWRFLRDFLSRGHHINMNLCISEMKLLEERTRRCYSESVNLDSNAFVEMMLLDGCFVLEFFLKCYEGNSNSIFEVGWNSAFILSDLRLLENQIPFFVVEKLYEIGIQPDDRMNFLNYLASFMARGPTGNSSIPNPPSTIHHLVHLCYHCSVPNPGKPVVLSSKSFDLSRMLSPSRIKYLLLGFLLRVLRFPVTRSRAPAIPFATGNRSVMVIPCATELQDTGVKFRPKLSPCHMFDISFDHGVLEIPRLQITDDTKPLFANLVAFEQCKLGEIKAHLTSFASFLDSLVNTQKDVMILQQCGIIENCLSSEEELTRFFNQVSEGAVLMEDHFLAELFIEVNRYCESTWNRQRARFLHDYFSSPWAAISLIAALILLVLTCVQSFFAVYAYFVPPSSR
ncbi:hypothetical protein LUZ61_003356 [Rhynchospora tenuis]|uniref:Uncharacterized protein n=1 Tax=Rhynchospora tenuis TaxID=198213 RepID=A0AAD5ZKT5_9POAL|nr:hypothetical protein LUZ61_003356 [Rhynchospora tenuis]